jgi:hypothetical protein
VLLSNWPKISLGVALSLAAATGAFRSAVEGTFATRGHPLALKLAPSSPALLTNLASATSRQIVVGKTPAPLVAKTAEQAQRALRSQPFNPIALRSLGVARIAMGNKGRGEQLLLLAGDMTHRDLVTQAWLFDHFLLTGKLGEAFNAIDFALRVREEIRPLLFPKLAKALEKSPELQLALRPYFTKDNPWAAQFVSSTLNLPGGGKVIADFARRIDGFPDNHLFNNLQPEVVRHLLEDGQYADARGYLYFYDNRADALLNRLEFSPVNIDPSRSAFAWHMENAGGVYTEFVRPNARESESELLIDVGQQQDGVLLTKVLMLEPGTYRFHARSAKGAPNYHWSVWQIRCKRSGAELARAEPGQTKTFTLPSDGCAAQEIALRMTRDSGAVASVYTARMPAPQLSRL